MSDFIYDAFISYSRQDAEIVDEIYSRLSKYRTPRALRKTEGRYGVPPRRLNVFLDRKSVEAGGSLSGRLREKLAQSRWLILICSKHSKDRPWVNQEIELFAADQGTEFIIPILVRDSEDTAMKEVLPPALLALDADIPIGADLILDGGIVPVRDKILGAVLGFSQNDISREQERDDARARRGAAAIFVAGLGLVAIAGIGLLLAYSYLRESTFKTSLTFAQQAEKYSDLTDYDTALLWAIGGLPAADQFISIDYSEAQAQFVRAYRNNIEFLGSTANAAISPLGGHVVTSSRSTVKIWDAETGILLHDLIGHDRDIRYLTFSPDGLLVASASFDNTVKLWNVETGRLLKTLSGSSSKHISFNSDGSLLAAGSIDGKVTIWSVATGRVRHNLRGHSQGVNRVDFHANGNLLATASSDGTVKIWNLSNGSQQRSIAAGKKYKNTSLAAQNDPSIAITTAPVESVTFSPDGTLVLTDSYDVAQLWEISTGRLVNTFDGHTSSISDTGFNFDGTQIFTTSYDQTAIIWDVSTGDVLHTLRDHFDSVQGAVFGPYGNRLLTVSSDRTGIVWDVTSGNALQVLKGHEDVLLHAAFSNDGDFVVTTSKDMSKLWDTETGNVQKTYDRDVSSATLNKAGSKLLTASDQTATLWDIRSGDSLLTLSDGNSIRISDAKFSPNDDLIIISYSTFGEPKSIVWDAESGEKLHVLEGSGPITFSPDGQLLVLSFSGETSIIWNTVTGKSYPALVWSSGYSSFHPDGSEFVTTYGSEVNIWDRDGYLLRSFDTKTKNLRMPQYSFDGDLIAIITGNDIKLWEANSFRPVHDLKGHSAPISHFEFSQDGAYLVTASQDQSAIVWDVASGRQLRVFQGHTEPLNVARFSPNTKRIITGSGDNSAKLWDVESGTELHTFKGHTNSIEAMFSPDGGLILTYASYDDPAKLWDAMSHTSRWTLEEMVTQGCERARINGINFYKEDTPILAGGANDGSDLKNPCDKRGILSPDWWRIQIEKMLPA